MKTKQTYYGDGYHIGMIPDITVFETDSLVKETGLLDSKGNKLVRKNKLGFDLTGTNNERSKY